MSGSYRVTILGVEGPNAVVKFESIYPDIGHLPGERNVAAPVLFEASEEMDRPTHSEGDPVPG